jgi:hypothetical protein
MVFLHMEKAMNSVIPCANCSHPFTPDPRVKNQRYCGGKDCQRARKREWQKEKLRTNPDYKEFGSFLYPPALPKSSTGS